MALCDLCFFFLLILSRTINSLVGDGKGKTSNMNDTTGPGYL